MNNKRKMKKKCPLSPPKFKIRKYILFLFQLRACAQNSAGLSPLHTPFKIKKGQSHLRGKKAG
jgi:hypothetical protein